LQTLVAQTRAVQARVMVAFSPSTSAPERRTIMALASAPGKLGK